MSAVRVSWRDYSEKFSVLTMREKVMITVAGLVAIVMIFSMLIIGPRLEVSEKVNASNQRLNKANNEQRKLHQELQAKLAQNPNDLVRAQLKEYQQQLTAIDANLTELTKHLITPKQMRPALTQLLKLERDVTLLSFEALPVNPITSKSDAVSNTEMAQDKAQNASQSQSLSSMNTSSGAVLYQHGIKLRLSGSYQALKRYLALVEDLPWRFYWQSFDFVVQEHPTAELELHLFSLSTKKDFIGV